jgi:hypothetical protein
VSFESSGNGAAGGSTTASAVSIGVAGGGSGGAARLSATVAWKVGASAQLGVARGSRSNGSMGGGGTTSTRSMVDACDVELLASFGANNAEMYCPQLAP